VSQRRRIGPPGRMRPAAPARPAHAGRLAPWERLAFALAFALMAAFVVVVTVSSEGLRRPAALPRVPAATPAAGRGGPQRVSAGGAPSAARGRRRAWDRRLAAALAPVRAGHAGTLGVGVIDQTTGAVAVYGGGTPFAAAGVEKVAILAGLLLDRSSGPGLGRADERLAARMTEAGDDTAGTALWDAAGQAAGLAAADQRLGLRHTVPGSARNWGATSTTVGDQLTLLRDLTSARSPLSAAARSYELKLLRAAGAGGPWGVSAAASAGTRYAIQDGTLADGPANWGITSVGVLDHDHQRLLMVVFCDGQPTKAAGVALAQAAAAAAAARLTAGP
jgi:hypothetical protein